VKILFLLYETVGFAELMPGETTFQQSVGDILVPDILSGQLCDEAFHDKKEKGEDFESAKLRITRGYLTLPACKT
jgi:hypothetical protein